MQQKRIQYLLDRYGANLATPEELTELQEYLSTSADSNAFEQAGYALMQQAAAGHQAPPDTATYQELLQQILSVDSSGTMKPARVARGRFRWMAAAAVLLILATAGILWLGRNKPSQVDTVTTTGAAAHKDIQPGRDGAVLTLADGTEVLLDSSGNGVVARQNGANIAIKNGRLLYDATTGSTDPIVYNTMRTPKGRQFQVTLPDGTGVWLNAGSSIHFPTRFTGKERRVEITGEAYFEVAKQPGMPFKVNISNRAEVEVLGTHFNVNAYDNEPGIRTTLLEGSVKMMGTVAGKESTAMLTPGQQAQWTPQQMQVIKNPDLNKVMAWKNGLFNFDGASLEEVMKQLERWYDIEVVYENGIPAIQFFGKMSKDMTLTQLLDALKTFDVHFSIEGKKLIIQK